MPSHNLTLLIGMPGAGKTAWARHHASGAVVSGRDQLRIARFGTNQDHSADEEIFAEQAALVAGWLEDGFDLIVEDAYHTPQRLRHIEDARSFGARVHAVFFANYAQARERNAARTVYPAPDYLDEERMGEIADELPNEGYDSIMWVGSYQLLSADRGGDPK